MDQSRQNLAAPRDNRGWTSGVVIVHASPRALLSHVSWAIGEALGADVDLDWTEQPAAVGSWRSALEFQASLGSGARVVSRLGKWPSLRLEISEQQTSTSDGMRYLVVPGLGLHAARIGCCGDTLVGEDALRAAIADGMTDGRRLVDVVDEALGGPWDRDLERFRLAADGSTVRWLDARTG